jgi:ADP-ribose pyrophosphatase
MKEEKPSTSASALVSALKPVSNRPLPKGVKLNSLNGEKVFSGVRFDVYQWKQKVFDGSVETYETIKRKDSVIVLPVVGNEVYLVNESQPHVEGSWLGVVAGGVEDGEDLEAAARREMLEETGMTFKNLCLVDVQQYMPGIEWFGYIFVATDFVSQESQSLEVGEKIELMKVTTEKLIELVKARAFRRFRPKFIEDYILSDDIDTLRDLLKNPEKYKFNA